MGQKPEEHGTRGHNTSMGSLKVRCKVTAATKPKCGAREIGILGWGEGGGLAWASVSVSAAGTTGAPVAPRLAALDVALKNCMPAKSREASAGRRGDAPDNLVRRCCWQLIVPGGNVSSALKQVQQEVAWALSSRSGLACQAQTARAAARRRNAAPHKKRKASLPGHARPRRAL